MDIHKHPLNSRQAMTNISSRGCCEVFNQRLLKILQKERVNVNFLMIGGWQGCYIYGKNSFR